MPAAIKKKSKELFKEILNNFYYSLHLYETWNGFNQNDFDVRGVFFKNKCYNLIKAAVQEFDLIPKFQSP